MSVPTIAVGDVFQMRNNTSCKVIQYKKANDVLVEFESGYVAKTRSDRLKSGYVVDKYSQGMPRIGDEFILNSGSVATVTSTDSVRRISIKTNYGFEAVVRLDHLKLGNVRDLLQPCVLGVGYLGVGEYKAKVNSKSTSAYNTWYGMLTRAYSKEFKLKFPTYDNVTVCEEWLNFQNFAKWFSDNQPTTETEPYHVDKDLKIYNNTEYSELACSYIPARINCMFGVICEGRGSLPLGVNLTKSGKYESRCVTGMRDNKENSSLFDTVEQATTHYWILKDQTVKDAILEYPEYKDLLLNYYIKFKEDFN